MYINNYLENLNNITKEIAYVFGFIWADGYVVNNGFGKHNYVVIKILKNDGENIKNIILSTSNKWNIYYYEPKDRQPTISFVLNSQNLSNFLTNNGKYSNSSENYNNILKIIPKNLHIYFYRGLIDGDGCFYKKDYYSYFSITGNYNQDWSSCEIFFNKESIKTNITRKHGEKSSYSRLEIRDKKSLLILINLLYNNKDNIFLKRKHDKAIEIKNYIEKRNDISNNIQIHKDRNKNCDITDAIGRKNIKLFLSLKKENNLLTTKRIVELYKSYGKKPLLISKILNDEGYLNNDKYITPALVFILYKRYENYKDFIDSEILKLKINK